MKRKCDICGRSATYHSVEVVKGQKIETHLCDHHASEAGIVEQPTTHAPINELLNNFVKLHSGAPSDAEKKSIAELSCDTCGLAFSDFRESSLLGCPACYGSFEEPLGPLLERAHQGGTHHIGKAPQRSGDLEQRQARIARLRSRLEDAVAAEDYELAAQIRDEIRQHGDGSQNVGASVDPAVEDADGGAA